MNEHIDLTFAAAKMATRNNEAASIAIHGVSAFYNVEQMARYRTLCYQEQYAIVNEGSCTLSSNMEQYRREMWKHTVLASIDILSLFINGLSGIRNGC